MTTHFSETKQGTSLRDAVGQPLRSKQVCNNEVAGANGICYSIYQDIVCDIRVLQG